MKKLKQTTWIVSLILGAWISTNSLAAPSVQHIFSNGQPANADHVNANFQELADRIEAMPIGPTGPQGEQGPQGEPGEGVAQINYDTYQHNFSSKTFLQSRPNIETGVFGPHQLEIRTYDRSTPGQIIVRRQWSNLENTQQSTIYRDSFFLYNPGQNRQFIRQERGDTLLSPEIYEIYEYSPGRTDFLTTMTVGVPWVSTSIGRTTETAIPQSGDYIDIEKRTVLGQESITVNNVEYTDCIKVLVEGSGPSSNSGAYDYSPVIQWHCAGVGLVKRVNKRNIIELISTTP